MSHSSFDADYYRRFYENPRTRVSTRGEAVRRAQMLAALVKSVELPVERILDAGCGLGWLRAPLLKAFPKATYVGLEVSAHLCREHGWVHRSVVEYRARAPFDLIVCYDVLQYLDNRQAELAIDNLAALSKGALYLHTPTKEDFEHNVDHSLSDTNVHLRTARWYQRRLARYFQPLGFGLHMRRGVPYQQWALERVAR